MPYRIPSITCLFGLLACSQSEQPPASTDTDGTSSADSSTTETLTPAADTTGSLPEDTTGSGTTALEPTTTGTTELPPPELQWQIPMAWGSVSAVGLHANDDIVAVGSRATSIESGEGYVQAVSADGVLGWRTEFGDASTATYFYEVGCAPDRSVYAVGLVGETTVWSSSQPHVVALDGDTGDVHWSVTLGGPFFGGELHGVHANDDGVYIAGRFRGPSIPSSTFYLAHYLPDGTEDWAYNAPIGGFNGRFEAVLRRGDTVLAVGTSSGFGSVGLVAAFTPEGEPLWVHAIEGADDTAALFIVEDLGADGVFVAGREDVAVAVVGGLQWGLSCSTTGCDTDPVFVSDFYDFYGFAFDGAGHRLTTNGLHLRAHTSEGDQVWSYETGVWQRFDTELSVLAVDSTGAMVMGGLEAGELAPPWLVKLRAADR